MKMTLSLKNGNSKIVKIRNESILARKRTNFENLFFYEPIFDLIPKKRDETSSNGFQSQKSRMLIRKIVMVF